MNLTTIKRFLPLHTQILLALVIGASLGYFTPGISAYISWIGDLFLRGLKMIIIPLTFSSIVAAIANIGSVSNFKRLGLKTISFFMLSTFMAILIGQFLVNFLEPGVGLSLLKDISPADVNTQSPSFLKIITDIVPTNIVKSMAEAEMLSVIFFAMIFGYCITKIEGKYNTLLVGFFNGTFEVMMKVTSYVLKLAPIGIMAIMAQMVSSNLDQLSSIALGVGKYSFTLILGISIHFFIVLPLLLKIIGKVNPFAHFKAMRNALLMAFSTCSSGATLPVTMKCAQENAGISKKTTGFVFPLGATINMDGTALYECVAAIFIAQVVGVDLSFTQQIVITFTALLASVGAAAIPQAGLIMLTVVLTSVNLPLAGIALILPVDRFLDMFRTSTNVWSDAVCAAVIAKSEGEQLKV